MATSLRRYFYECDLYGRLYLEGVKRKNIATCLKDDKFINFFYKQLKPTSFLRTHPKWVNLTTDFVTVELEEQYPYVSICGKELNFLKPEDVPIVYTKLLPTTATTTSTKENNSQKPLFQLSYGASLKVPFDPSALHLCTKKGYLYHPVPSVKQCGTLGLISSPLVLSEFQQSLSFEESGVFFHFEANHYQVKQV